MRVLYTNTATGAEMNISAEFSAKDELLLEIQIGGLAKRTRRLTEAEKKDFMWKHPLQWGENEVVVLGCDDPPYKAKDPHR